MKITYTMITKITLLTLIVIGGYFGETTFVQANNSLGTCILRPRGDLVPYGCDSFTDKQQCEFSCRNDDTGGELTTCDDGIGEDGRYHGAYGMCDWVENTPPPTNGTCGSSSGQTVSIRPTTNLCTTGTPSVVSGNGPWSRSCLGSNGGSTSPTCIANKSNTSGYGSSSAPLCPTCRPVLCKDQLGNVVADSFCASTPKPATGQVLACISTNTYTWTGTWGTCQAVLSCQTFITSLANEQTCGALTVANCASQPICMAQPYGAGNQTKDNVCKDQNGNIVADSLCTQPEPPTVQTCDGYARYASERGVCTNGTQTRTLTCKDSNGNVVNDSYCAQPKPVITRGCTSCSKCKQHFSTGPQTCGSAGFSSESVCEAIQGKPGPSDPIQGICYWDEYACSIEGGSEGNTYTCQSDGYWSNAGAICSPAAAPINIDAGGGGQTFTPGQTQCTTVQPSHCSCFKLPLSSNVIC